MKKSLFSLIAPLVFAAGVFAAEVAPALPKLVELGSTGCVPCKRMEPIIAELTKEQAGVLAVEFIDVKKNPKEAKSYKVRLIPTQVFLDTSGKELFRHEGYWSKKDIAAKWRELGVTLKSVEVAKPGSGTQAGEAPALAPGTCC